MADGSAARPARADVLIEGDRVVAVGPGLKSPAARVIDAGGLVVAPGFIDAHSHSDANALIDPLAEGRLRDGVATEINGTCGWGLFPLIGREADRKREGLRRQGIDPSWSDAAGYFQVVERAGSAVNRGFLLGQGAVRAAVMGYDHRPAGSRQIRAMRKLTSEALEQGALGLSSGLCYPPGSFAGRAEMAGLCRELAPLGRPYCTHMRSEGRALMASVREALAVAGVAGVPLHISHVKTFGRANWWKIGPLESALAAARAAGRDVTADRYPYTAAMTDLETIFPDRLLAGGKERAVARLTRPRSREAFRRAALRGRRLLWDQIMISTAAEPAREFQGMTVARAAERMGLEPFDAVVEMLVATRFRVTAIFFDMSEDNLTRILRWPFVCIGSDSAARSFSGPTAKGCPHPRTFGSCARFLGEYVLRKELMPLAEGVRKLTALPADRFGLKDRGRLRPGAFADVVIFDPAQLRDAATYADPFRPSEGVRWLFVNGAAVVDNGTLTRARPGRVLRA